MKSTSKFVNYLLTFLKILFISYLVAVVYFFMNSYNHVDSPNLTLQERIMKSFITPIALIIWFIVLILYVPWNKWGPSGPSAYSTPRV